MDTKTDSPVPCFSAYLSRFRLWAVAALLLLSLMMIGLALPSEKDTTQIFMIGDSTMADKPLLDNPERGWGQLLPLSFTDEVVIRNHAVNGRSTRSFIDEKRWDAVMKQLRRDDWVMIQFGHNDQKKEDPARYAAPQSDYKNNLARFISDTRSKGAHPILLTPVMRRRFDEQGKFFDTHGEYPDAVRALAKELSVPLIDLHKSSKKLIEQAGSEKSKEFFLWIAPGKYQSLPEGKKDDTHFSEFGALKMAWLVVEELRQMDLPLARFLKNQAVNPEAQTITVQVDKPGASISGRQFGIFFEDINFGADGGIYAELIKNRSFEFPEALMGWSPVSGNSSGSMKVSQHDKAANNRHYLRVTTDPSGKGFGFANSGFRGIGVRQSATYDFSVQARNAEPGSVNLRLALVSAEGKTLASAVIKNISGNWKTYSASLRATVADNKAQLQIVVESRGGKSATVDLDMISLFPRETWRGRSNGLRSDLVQLLADLKPGFVRFPGGCIVEGRELETRYQWKTTIGDVAERKLIVNRWNTEFKHKPAPDYYQSFGLGFYEYFLLSEDIGAEPLPIINCGMACQFNTNELAPMDQLDPYIQDALDLIEFANGSIVTKWGRKRAELGHPAPFNLKMIGIGNEQWGPQYIERYEQFARVLKAKYPNVKLVSSAGPAPEGELFNFLWPKLRALNADLVDEHYYQRPDWFLKNSGRYDRYDRNGPKVFAGEYAAQSSGVAKPDNRNNWECALSEAAFITGLERNADIVELSSYAPLFGHVDAWQWTPNLIWFDNVRSFGTPNYYVQKLFSNHQGNRILPVQINGSAQNGQALIYASAVRDERSGEVIVKLVNARNAASEVSISLAGGNLTGKPGKAFVLASNNLKSENTLNESKAVAPMERSLEIRGTQFSYSLPAQSMVVLRMPCTR